MAREEYLRDEPFTIEGHWWRPGGPHRPAGDLEYRDRKIELRLLGALDDAIGDTPFDRVPEVSQPDIIYGESLKGTPITLLGSFYTAWRPGGDFLGKPPLPITSSKLTSNRLLVGLHLPSESNACFRNCYLTIPNLERWLDDRPFCFEHSSIDDRTCFTLTYTEPQSKIFGVSDSIGVLRIKYSAGQSGQWDQGTVSHRAFVVIEANEPKTLAWFIDLAGQLERFFTLLTGRPVQTVRTRLYLEAGVGDGIHEDALLYLPQRHIEQPELNPADFLFRYPDIQEWFPQMLKSWLTASADIRHALDLLFSSIREPAPFLESRFLPIVQAAEVYARAAAPGLVVDKTEFKSIRKRIVKSIPDDVPGELRDAIVGSFAHANEFRLAQRLHALIDSLDEETVGLFCNDRNDFVRGIVNTRNYFTHYTERYDRILQGLEIHWAALKLTTMLKVLLLTRLGIPEAQLQALLRKDHRTSHERRAWKDVSELGSPFEKKASNEWG